MSKHFIALAAMSALAACSAGLAPEAAETSSTLVFQQADLAPELEGAPVSRPEAPAYSSALPERAALAKHDTNLFCDIAVVKTSRGVRITPIVRSDRSLSGEYSIVITKSGAGGSSDISQGGPFDAARGVRQTLGASEISLERGASFRAVLKVRAGGREVCRDIRS